MKYFFSLAFLLTCPLVAYGAHTPELFEKGKSPNFDGINRYRIKSHIVCPMQFSKIPCNKKESDFIYYGNDQRSNDGLSESDVMLLAFIRCKNDNTISILLDEWRIFKESDREEAVEELMLHVKDNKDINQKSVYVTRGICNKNVKEICVEPVVCYWGAKTKIKIPDVGKWANQYSLSVIPTKMKLIIEAIPEYKK